MSSQVQYCEQRGLRTLHVENIIWRSRSCEYGVRSLNIDNEEISAKTYSIMWELFCHKYRAHNNDEIFMSCVRTKVQDASD
jgi:hypothetical protein